MSNARYRNAGAWLLQAQSDVRTAEALLCQPAPMQVRDVGAHVAATCAQALEKSLKGYLFVNGITPAMDHRPDKYLPLLLDRSLLRYLGHFGHLSRLFDTHTKAIIKELFELTPGGHGRTTAVPNTEYPWQEGAEWRHTPYEHAPFSDRAQHQNWFAVAQRVCNGLSKLREATL